jgi:protein-S-isoprenylcysteine O-methyltransferase Ste14
VTNKNPLSRLELKIPPLALVLVMAGLMWLVAKYLPVAPIHRGVAWLGTASLAIAGVACIVSGGLQFRTARTTVNPTTPAAASALVTSGIYRHTRNPMYVGMTLILLAWSVWLSSLYSLIVPVAFVLYMNRFQIRPEEEALQDRFGEEFLAYKRGVRRWF